MEMVKVVDQDTQETVAILPSGELRHAMAHFERVKADELMPILTFTFAPQTGENAKIVVQTLDEYFDGFDVSTAINRWETENAMVIEVICNCTRERADKLYAQLIERVAPKKKAKRAKKAK